MVSPDKVLKAEEDIRAIAAELERMRTAAQILENAEVRASAVVEASKSIIEIGNRLVGELDAHSIASIMEPRFEALKERANQLSEDVKTGFGDTAPRLEALRERADTLSEGVKTGFSYLKPLLADLELELRRIRKRQIVIATFAIAAFIAASGGIAVGVLFGL